MLIRRILVRDRIKLPGCRVRPWRRAQSKQSMDNIIQVLHTRKKIPRRDQRRERSLEKVLKCSEIPATRSKRSEPADSKPHTIIVARGSSARETPLIANPCPPLYRGGVSCAGKIPVIILKCNKSRKINATMNGRLLMIGATSWNPNITSCICSQTRNPRFRCWVVE